MPCLPANPDISGIGVRVAIYSQNLLSFLPAFFALLDDGRISDEELETIERQATTILITAMAILISTIVEAVTKELSGIHASIILNLSWMNNTNLFIYLLLYLHLVAMRATESPWTWRFWWKHLRDVCQEWGKNRHTEHDGTKPVVPRGIVMLLGSVHLSLMASVGIWLWIEPTIFGHIPLNTCLKTPRIVIVGGHVAITSSTLQAVSLALYSTALSPALNIALPLFGVIFFYIRFNRNRESGFRSGIVKLASLRSPFATTSDPNGESLQQAFPITVCLWLLVFINLIFLVDTETTIRLNSSEWESGEAAWTFGQTLASLLIFIPARDVWEALARRREKKAQGRFHEALLQEEFESMKTYLKDGVNPEPKGAVNQAREFDNMKSDK